MNVIIYIFTFLIGITFVSFFTLAVYRIPLGKDITHERSFCPNCNHKLGFLDLIPIFSYIFLGGKCRYCKQKIRPRYLLLELLSGIVFVLFAFSIKMNIFALSVPKIVYLVFGLLYIAGLFIISGIDKEKIQIQNELIIYLTIVQTMYIIYLYTLGNVDMYRYVIYLSALAILTTANTIFYKKNLRDSYTLNVLSLICLMAMFTYELQTIATVIFTLLIIGIKSIIDKIVKNRTKYIKKDAKNKNTIPFGFYLCVTNIIILLVSNISVFYNF